MKTFWMNGSLCSEAEAKVSVLDHGLLYGDGVFEGIRCTEGRVLDLELHLTRLETAARAIHLKLPLRSELRNAVLQCLSAQGSPEAYARLVVTRGVGELGIDTKTCGEPVMFCIAGGIRLYATTDTGLKLATVSLRRPAFDMLDPRVKSLNYLNNVLARLEAQQRGADEALVLNARGTIAEASAANLFAVMDGVAVTPPASDGALAGITRRRVLKLLAETGVPTREASLTRFDLFGAEEVFLTGTGAGVVSVGSLDGEAIAPSRQLAPQLQALTRAYATAFGTVVPGF